jgi:molecular chaperone GrpE
MNPEDQVETPTEATPEPNAELVALQERVAQLEAELANAKAEAVRGQAEAQNIIRRQRTTLEEAIKFAPQGLVEALLPVLDNFERTRKALSSGATPEKILEGVDAIERQFRAALSQVNVERIASEGVEFDPQLHEALLTETGTDQPDHTILSELEAGYTMYGRVVRPARVKVAVDS